MYKKFYSIEYNNIGYWKPRTAWFDSKEELEKFAEKQDGANKAIIHRYSKPESIKRAERLVKETAWEWSL